MNFFCCFRILYFIDSLSKDIAAFDYDEDTGDLSNRRSALNKEKAGLTGKLDGMTIDTRGNLWVAVFGEGKVHSAWLIAFLDNVTLFIGIMYTQLQCL